MSEYEQILEFMRALEERSAEFTVGSRFGTVLVNEQLGRVHDLNFLRADSPEEASAGELAAETERIQGLIGLRHRRVAVMDRAESERLRPGFLDLGWRTTAYVVMASRRAPEREADLSTVREADPAELRPFWAEAIRNAPFAQDEEVVEQLVAWKDVIAEAIPTRYYIAEAEGEIGAYCEFYSEGGIGQFEAVMTRKQHRNRGLASALVLKSLEQSRADGNELTFLIALENDWPRKLYERLGFETVGLFDDFLKSPA
jgi:ribosomal protein S18 acetylase RimI-like enzyme